MTAAAEGQLLIAFKIDALLIMIDDSRMFWCSDKASKMVFNMPSIRASQVA